MKYNHSVREEDYKTIWSGSKGINGHHKKAISEECRSVGDLERFKVSRSGESGGLSVRVKKEAAERTTSRDQWCQRLDLPGWKELNY